MVETHLIIAGTSIALGIIGISRVIYWILFLIAFLCGFLLYTVFNRKKRNRAQITATSSYTRPRLLTHVDDIEIKLSSSRPSNTNIERTPLTGSRVIDEPLYELIDYFVRDYIEIWYKTQISSDEDFIKDVRNGIYTTIQHLSDRMREIDWLEFCTTTVVDSFSTHVRLFRNAKERIRLERPANVDVKSVFFDLEAEYEHGICRDEVCTDKKAET
ncbi:unnamed protein product, partial [Didymodactylos carnosus]